MQNNNLNIIFKVHHPIELVKHNIFDKKMFTEHNYFSLSQKEYIKKVKKDFKDTYYPLNALISELTTNNPNLKFDFYISGSTIELLKAVDEELLQSFLEITQSKSINLYNGINYHSLAGHYSLKELLEQITLHRSLIWKTFKQKPKVFFLDNYPISKEILSVLGLLGYENAVIQIEKTKNASLEIANFKTKTNDNLDFQIIEQHRFSKAKESVKYVLAEEFKMDAISNLQTSNSIVKNQKQFSTKTIIFEYQKIANNNQEGVFDFLENLPQFLKDLNLETCNFASIKKNNKLTQTNLIGIEESNQLNALNNMQKKALETVYNLEEKINALKSKRTFINKHFNFLSTWRKLQSFDHISLMSTKQWESKKKHNPYGSPYDAFINYMNILEDFTENIAKF